MDELADSILLQELQAVESERNQELEQPSTSYKSTRVDLPSNRKASSSRDTFSALKQAIGKLQSKLREPTKKKFYLHKSYNSHILPLTNVCFDRSGERCLTGSYDRTCHVIGTSDAQVQHILTGHDNVVFSVGFNTPRW